MGKKLLETLIAVSLSLVFAGIAGEMFVRFAMASDSKLLEKFRQPMHYADWFSTDYWKLEKRFARTDTISTMPHPLLGWVGDFSGDTYLHDRADEVDGRRPVLLFGDSFTQGVGEAERIQDILNSDEAFNAGHYALNYGTKGYGVDQILLLMEESLKPFEDPYVVFGFMTLDLDRSLLRVRPQQKPFFTIVEDELVLHTPTDQPIGEYLADNPPGIRSYLYRMIVHNKRFPQALSHRLRGMEERRKHVEQLNTMLLERGIDELRRRELDFTILVFHPNWPGVSTLGERDWRDSFVRPLLHRLGVAYIWSKELIRNDAKVSSRDYSEYYQEGNAHPTTLYNGLVAATIRDSVLPR